MENHVRLTGVRHDHESVVTQTRPFFPNHQTTMSTGLDHNISPEYETLFDPATCTRKGLCPVTQIRDQGPLGSHSLYYEQHGTGPEKVIFIMGYVQLG